MNDHRTEGGIAESRAMLWLLRSGWRIVERNAVTPFGELDLVMLDGDTLVFVEVKYRTTEDFGSPEESVTPRKLGRLRRSIDTYRLRHGWTGPYRLDVIAMEPEKPLRHLRGIGERDR